MSQREMYRQEKLEWRLLALKMEGDREPIDAGGVQKLEEKAQTLPESLQREHSPSNIDFSPISPVLVF